MCWFVVLLKHCLLIISSFHCFQMTGLIYNGFNLIERYFQHNQNAIFAVKYTNISQ